MPELVKAKIRDNEHHPLPDDGSSVYSQPHPGEAGYTEPEKNDSQHNTEHIIKGDSEEDDIVVVKTKSRDPGEPTEEELTTLRRVPGVLPFVCYTIAFIEFCERLSFCGILTVFVNYIQQPLPEGSVTGAGGPNGQSGALGLGQKIATALVSFYSLWVYLMPLFGAYLADTRWGRYRTIVYAIFVTIFGHAILVICSIPRIIIMPKLSMGLIIVAMVIIGMGTGTLKACCGTFMTEQTLNARSKVKVLKCGERVIVDNEMTVTRSYMYLYLFLNVGALAGKLGAAFAEKYIGFWLSYLIPTFMFMLCPFVMLWGRKRYVRVEPSGSVVAQAIKLIKHATKGRWSWNPITTYMKLSSPDMWDRATPSRIPEEVRPDWMTFDDDWVAEVERGLKACKVFLFYPFLWLAFLQMLHNFTSQAATMMCYGLPNDFFSNLNPIVLITMIPVFDQIIYPGLRRAKIDFSPLRRIFCGFLCITAALIWSAVVQYNIYKTSPCGKFANGCDEPSPISAWLQAGPFGLIAFGEILAVTTGMEYCFSKAPANMRSLVYSIYLVMTTIAGLISQAFVPLSDDPLLVHNYAIIAGILGLNCILFAWAFFKVDKAERTYRKNGMVEIKVGKAAGAEDSENPSEKR
ncbi:putative PTR2-Di-and tripeptide permease [Pyronema omphalodes]|nr:putative PTR2-Di-and tripeptide permease [Pyronema omphalodes]